MRTLGTIIGTEPSHRAVLRLADFHRDRWMPADALWEELELAAVQRIVRGERAGPGALLERALATAERWFAGDDPRLAASLTNLARWRQETGVATDAVALFDRAIEHWQMAESWVPRVQVADASLAEAQCLRLVAEGHRHATALRNRRPILIACGLERWRARRPGGRPDRRKLLAAIFLSTYRLTRPDVAGSPTKLGALSCRGSRQPSP